MYPRGINTQFDIPSTERPESARSINLAIEFKCVEVQQKISWIRSNHEAGREAESRLFLLGLHAGPWLHRALGAALDAHRYTLAMVKLGPALDMAVVGLPNRVAIVSKYPHREEYDTPK
jgi:hypothetical protein